MGFRRLFDPPDRSRLPQLQKLLVRDARLTQIGVGRVETGGDGGGIGRRGHKISWWFL
jgi:hypothetical protein